MALKISNMALSSVYDGPSEQHAKTDCESDMKSNGLGCLIWTRAWPKEGHQRAKMAVNVLSMAQHTSQHGPQEFDLAQDGQG